MGRLWDFFCYVLTGANSLDYGFAAAGFLAAWRGSGADGPQ